MTYTNHDPLTTANAVTPDFQALCKSLLHCMDTGNTEAEELVLCQIRVALREAEQAPLVTATTGGAR